MRTGVALEQWIGACQPVRRRATKEQAPPGLRFAFYGRMSTCRFQDERTSRGWQREVAEELVAGRGTIEAEFFDVGVSRRLPWQDRPQAAALLAMVATPPCPFDAVVVGEYERAFSGDQLSVLLPLLVNHGVQLWLPEAAGAVEPDSPMHQALITVLGAQAQREVVRARYRALAAMQVQAAEQGRYMGGRPPYGFLLVEAGPHPNQAHASWGRMLRRLAPDPRTAPIVIWIFETRRRGESIATIARLLNERGVPCPSSVDRARNPHRTAEGWTVGTVTAILQNLRYTGHQLWNRQRTEHHRGSPSTRVWNDPQDWVISPEPVHPPLISVELFTTVQGMRAARTAADGSHRSYRLSGLVICGLCGRRMDSNWVNGRASYRCRHGHTSAKPTGPDRIKNLYVREDRLLELLAARLGLADHDEITHHLKDQGLVVIYRPADLAIQPAQSERRGPQTRPA